MRDYKLRGRTLEQCGMLPAGSWVTGGYYKDDAYGGTPAVYILTWNSGGPGGFMERLQVDPETVGQYTGLKDKIGTEIYEGDVMEVDCGCDPGEYACCTHAPSREIVIWNEDSSGFVTKSIHTNGLEEFSSDYTDSFRVIGNIHQHPELLKGGRD